MLGAIKQFFDQNIRPPATAGIDPEHALRLATAALMIEMMRMDRDEHPDEWRVIGEVLQSRFDLEADETAELISLAGREAEDPSDYYQFTSLINKSYSVQEKAVIIEHLWQVAYADGKLDDHEEYLVRRIAGLLGIDNQEFIAAKHRVRDSA